MWITFLDFGDNVEKLFLRLCYKGEYVYKVVDKTGEVRPLMIVLFIPLFAGW